MSTQLSVWIFQAINAVGLSLWLLIAALNNCKGFAGSVGAVGATLSMAPLKEAPAIDTPLLGRALAAPWWPRLALGVVLALQVFAALACLVGTYQLLVGGDLARPALAEPGPEWVRRVHLRHAPGRVVVRLLDSPGRLATDPPGAADLGQPGIFSL